RRIVRSASCLSWTSIEQPNGSRLSCGALKKDSFHNLRAPPASSAGIVLPMAANPEPEHSIGRTHSQCTIVDTYADGVKATYALEVQRRMTRIRLEKLELPISQ